MKNNKKPKNKIEVKFEYLDQYDYHGGALTPEREKKYAFLIGTFLMDFSDLERTLDIEIANLISDRSHDEGYIIIKNLKFSAKRELFYDLFFPRIFYAKKKKENANQLKLIRKKLEALATLRNKIAHAKWYTLDKEGYVRVDVNTNKDNGLIRFKRFKITPTIIKNGIKEIEKLNKKLPDLNENIQY